MKTAAILTLCCAAIAMAQSTESATDSPPTTVTTEPPPPPKTTTKAPGPVPPPSPPTVPDAEQYQYQLNSTDGAHSCVLAKFSAQFAVQYNNSMGKLVTAKVNVDNSSMVDASKSYCGAAAARLSITFKNGHLNLTDRLVLDFVNDNTTRWVANVTVELEPNEQQFPGWQFDNETVTPPPVSILFENVTLFKVGKDSSGKDQSYTCTSEMAKTQLDGHDVTVQFGSIQVEAFRKNGADDRSFSTPKNCVATHISDVVPIAVGCALLALVVIVLIAYFIGRRRSRRLAYQSV